jgi:hypothetical protein
MANVFTVQKVSLDQISGRVCAWKGCACTTGLDAMPSGWVNLITYARPRPDAKLVKRGKVAVYIRDGEWIRDAVLCAQHAMELELKLVDLGRALDAPAQGSA